jgi:O-antigen/teichoic acid export membrane protein
LVDAALDCDGVMIGPVLRRLARQTAAGTLFLRAGVVGANFAVMMGLAAWLGLATFGQIALMWGAALVAGTVVSVGGPLILLRALTDGGGMRRWDILALIVVYPLALAVAGYFVLTALAPSFAWAAILGAGVALNALGCLASVMRALGSVQASMVLRDAGPQVALGVAAVIAGKADAAVIMFVAACVMAGLAALIGLCCLMLRPKTTLISDSAKPAWSVSLWGTSVLGMAVAQMDLLVGGAVLPSEALGVYALLRRIANLVALPVSVATWVSGAPVSTAFGADDMKALRKASAAGSQIAFIPGAALFAIGIAGLPFLSFAVPDGALADVQWVLAILLTGAFVQVSLASSFTVATLCGLARLSVVARLSALLIYGAAAAILGASLSPITNAASYTVAMSLGSLLLWILLLRRLGLDTSAMVMTRRKGLAWKLS